MTYSIGEFSKMVELPADTLRYYEKEKLVFPKRNEVNRRIYDETDVSWIEFIKRLKQTGMSIRNIKEYAHLRYQGDKTIEKRMELLYEQQEILESQKQEIEQHIDFLANKIDAYKCMLL